MTGNRFILDTNIVIDLFQGSQNIADHIQQAEAILLPAPVLGELYIGAEKSQRTDYHLSLIEKFLEITTVLDVDKQTARVYSKIKVALQRKGKPIPENDIWIASRA